MGNKLFVAKLKTGSETIWVIAPDKKAAMTKGLAYFNRSGGKHKESSMVLEQVQVGTKNTGYNPLTITGYARDGENLVFNFVVKSNSYALDDLRFGVYEVNKG